MISPPWAVSIFAQKLGPSRLKSGISVDVRGMPVSERFRSRKVSAHLESPPTNVKI